MEPVLRRLIVGAELRPRPPDELPELLRQLSGMAVNINQIAKVANARGFVRMEDIDRIKAMQGLLWRTMKRPLIWPLLRSSPSATGWISA